jgi:hypothetical protein
VFAIVGRNMARWGQAIHGFSATLSVHQLSTVAVAAYFCTHRGQSENELARGGWSVTQITVHRGILHHIGNNQSAGANDDEQ